MKKLWLSAAALAFFALSLGALRIFYVGGEPLLVGKVGEYDVVACETVHSFGSLVSRDARGGYYRIYNRDGDKVFEVFSDGFAFDVVITSDDQAEFQLHSGETKFWGRP